MLQSLIKKVVKNFLKKPVGRRVELGIGGEGEDLAARYLKKEKGYKLVARNWRYKQDEIDIIAKDGEVLVFLEVKTSSIDGLVPTYYRVTKKKKSRLERACKAYVKGVRPCPKHFRFDIVTVKLCKEGESSVRHYTNVRLFSKNFHTLSNE